ncbi:hypothetical protein V2J09_000765 [Rumex salicifolius]
MENADAFTSSTAPLTWHDFLERMRQPSAAEFVKSIKSFIVSFSNNAPESERDSASVQQFLANMEGAFRAHPLWAGCLEEELESAGEGLEKYVMTKLFAHVFASLPDDIKADEQLSEKIALVQQFIRPEHLDIRPPYQNETSWLLAQKELQKINMYKAPREKLVINNLLLNASIASNGDPPGADEFLPILIFVTLKANPPQLHSNLMYIQRYRRRSRLVSEAAYYFTNILSAESFILNMDAQSLSMDETEFERNMDSARALLSGLSSDFENNLNLESACISSSMEFKSLNMYGKDFMKQTQTSSPFSGAKSSSKEEQRTKDRTPTTKAESISSLEEKGASVLLKEDHISSVFQEFPYAFANVGDLTLNDVEDLLSNYKKLVFKYVCLAKGLGVEPSSSFSHSFEQTQAMDEAMKGSEDERALDTYNKVLDTAEEKEEAENKISHFETKLSEEAISLPGEEDTQESKPPLEEQHHE